MGIKVFPDHRSSFPAMAVRNALHPYQEVWGLSLGLKALGTVRALHSSRPCTPAGVGRSDIEHPTPSWGVCSALLLGEGWHSHSVFEGKRNAGVVLVFVY